MYASVMVDIAAPVATHSTVSVSLAILVVIVLLAALAAAGYFSGRDYVNRRLHRRNWK